MEDNREELRRNIRANLEAIYTLEQRAEEFIPGVTPILTGKAIFGFPEVAASVETLLDGWLGLGKKGEAFENAFAEYIGCRHAVLVNSGSSANLVALNAVKIDRHLKSGEIITPACTFPTTFNPILQLGFVPAVVDIDSSLNISLAGIAKAMNPRTVGIMFGHTLGNPAQIEEIKHLAEKKGLFVVEDCCDALGSSYNGKVCGSSGLCSTYSFYPAHGITLGEGGAVVTDSSSLKRILRSLRDWGRACWCNTDEKNKLGACRSRFDFEVDGIPYDHKYTFSQVGYNLKPLEMQAAFGLEQLKRLPGFNEIRRRNYQLYLERFQTLEKFFDFAKIHPSAEPVFFGFPLILKQEAGTRKDLIWHLNQKGIGTRLLFAGNILRQPAYKNETVRVYQEPTNSDRIMRDCFWIGCHAGVTKEMIDYVFNTIREYFKA